MSRSKLEKCEKQKRQKNREKNLLWAESEGRSDETRDGEKATAEHFTLDRIKGRVRKSQLGRYTENTGKKVPVAKLPPTATCT